MSAKIPPPFARKPRSRKRSRSDQLAQVESGCRHVAGRSHPGLVFAANGGAGDLERLPEPAGSGAFCHPAPQGPDGGGGPKVQASAV